MKRFNSWFNLEAKQEVFDNNLIISFAE